MQNEQPTEVIPLIREKSSVICGTSCSARRNCRTDLYVALVVCGTLLIMTFIVLLTVVVTLGGGH